MSHAAQSQKAASVYFTSKQILPVGFAKQYCINYTNQGNNVSPTLFIEYEGRENSFSTLDQNFSNFIINYES